MSGAFRLSARSAGSGRRLLALPAGRRAKWGLLAFWLVVMALAGPYAGKLPKVEKNDAIAYLPASAQSTKVNKALAGFPGGRQVPGVVLYVKRSGVLSAADQSIAAGQRELAARMLPDFKPQAISLSRDRRALAYSFEVSQPDATKLTKEIDALRASVSGAARLKGYVTGAAGLVADSSRAFNGIDGLLLAVAGTVVIALLLLIYRSPALWLMPVLGVVAAISLAEWAVYQLARHAGLTVSGQSGGILTVLVFGAGTDYALLLTARYREELHRHEDHHDAMRAAIGRAAPAIVASASTVVLGLLCLLAAELNSESGLGPIGAIGILAALLAQLTFLPALLVLFGRRLFWPMKPRVGSVAHADDGLWARLAGGIARRPRAIWGASVAALLVMSIGVGWLKLGMRQSEAFINKPQSVIGQQIYAKHYPAGGGEPVIVIADANRTLPVLRSLRSDKAVSGAFPAGAAGGRVKLLAILSSAPDSNRSYAAVSRIRSALAAIPGAHALVGGDIATILDTRAAAIDDRALLMPLVLVVVVAILALLLRAIIAPLLLAATVVLSFAAALGFSTLAFAVFGFSGVDQSIPLLAYIFLVALGVDYNIFLVSRIREETLQCGTKAGTSIGLQVTGGVITSAGVVLAATFAALMALPLVALAEIGFIVAFGVLLDTLLVRSVLVPALLSDIGRHVWWPSALARSRQP